MPNFRATHTDGTVVEYTDTLPDPEHLAEGWRLDEISIASVAPDTPPDTRMFGGRRRLTKLEFVVLLGAAFPAMLREAKVSVEAEVLVKMVEYTTPEPDGTSIDLDDPRIAGGLAQMEQAGAVPAGTTETVIHG